MKKIITISTLAAIIATTGITAYAATYKTPAEAAAGVTGKTIEEVTTIRQNENKSYGTIAKEAGKLDEFKKEVLEMKKERLNTLVKEDKITQTKADEIISNIEKRQQTCDGTPNNNGDKLNLGLGQGNGKGQGKGQGRGQGNRLQDGSCTN
ncbi:MAG: hypothetical protein WBO70_00675 [Erysipelotrichaceae bacterium]